MLGTYRSQTGIAVAVYKPEIVVTSGSPNTVTYDPTGTFLRNLHPVTYGQKISAMGGYLSAQMTLSEADMYLELLLDQLLGAHIEVYDENSEQVWEGFVDKLTLNINGVEVTYGPITDIINRVVVRYKRIYTGTNPPDTGSTVNTPIYEHTDSQRKFGIRYAVVNAGERTDTDAAQVAQSVLENRAMPRPKTRYATSSSESPIIKLDAAGYWALLKQQPYYAESDAEIDLSDKIADVLDAEPNGVLDSTNAYIEANTIQVPENDDTYRDCWTVLTNLCQRGTAAYARTTLMVGNGRRVTYAVASDEVSYVLKPAASGFVVSAGWTDSLVPEARVKAGRWAYLTMALPMLGEPLFDDLPNDPRALFIEEASWDVGQGLKLDGTGKDALSSRLESYELGTAVR